MIATISAIAKRTPQYVSFNVDDSSLIQEGERISSTSITLNGSGVSTDWGYPVAGNEISLNNVVLTEQQYQVLIGMLRDSDGHRFYFAYINRLSEVILKTVPVNVGGDPKTVAITMIVVKEIPQPYEWHPEPGQTPGSSCALAVDLTGDTGVILNEDFVLGTTAEEPALPGPGNYYYYWGRLALSYVSDRVAFCPVNCEGNYDDAVIIGHNDVCAEVDDIGLCSCWYLEDTDPPLAGGIFRFLIYIPEAYMPVIADYNWEVIGAE